MEEFAEAGVAVIRSFLQEYMLFKTLLPSTKQKEAHYIARRRNTDNYTAEQHAGSRVRV